jgi:hypothetical protein
MAFTDNGTGMYMPVAPAYGGNGGFGNGFGGDGAWWIIVLFLFAMGGGRWGNGFGGGFGNGGYGGGDNVAIGNLGGGYRDAVQAGFDQQAVMSGINTLSSNVQNGFSNTATSLCNGFAGVNATVNNGFANAEIANNSRQIANMQQQFASQTAITSGMNGLQSQLAQCCCDNRLATANLNSTILAENCADRQALSEGFTQMLINNNANTQRMVDTANAGFQSIQDKLCQLEIDGIKQNYENRILGLQNALDAARLENQNLQNAAARTAQTAQILADNGNQTAALENYLNPPARPAYIVQNPNCCANNYYTGGCCNAA